MGGLIMHYPHSKVILRENEEIHFQYVGDVSNFGASTFKRLFGWESNKSYIGIVKGESVNVLDCKTRKHLFQHHLYNIEYDISSGKINLNRHLKNTIQLSLFDGV